MIDSVLEKVYSMIESILIEGVEPSYLEEMRKNYIKTLNLKYYDDYKDYDDFDMLFEAIMDFEKSSLEFLTPGEKKSLYIKDEAYEKIQEISRNAESLAWNRKETGEIAETPLCENYIYQLTVLLNQVADFNKNVAEILVSESLVDLAYACGRTENTSLRMGH